MERNLNKKLLLVTLKHSTWVIGLVYLIECILSCFGIQSVFLLALCGSSVIPFLVILLFSFQLGYCFWHRMPIYVTLTNDFINIIDFYIGIPVPCKIMLMIYLISALLIALIGSIIKNRKNVNKRDVKESLSRHSG